MARREAKAKKKVARKKKGRAKQRAGSAVKVAAKPVKRAEAPAAPARWYRVCAQFLREVKVELKKVTWPTFKDTKASTLVVLLVVVICAAFLGFVDLGLSWVMRLFIW